MADKKLITYDCTLSFSFQTKEDDFMNPDFTFGHACICMDSIFGASITLSGSPNAKHPIILCDLENVLFSCSPVGFVDLTSQDVFKAVMAHRDCDDIGGCVFMFQPVKGSRFLLGATERILNEKSKTESPSKSEKFQRRRRNKKA